MKLKGTIIFWLICGLSVLMYNQNLNAQEVIIEQTNVLPGWIESTQSLPTKHGAYFVPNEDLPSRADQENFEAALYINYLSKGGINVGVSGGNINSLYSSYIQDKEDGDYLDAYRQSRLSRSDYFISKYADRPPSDLMSTIINGRNTIYYTVNSSDGGDEYNQYKMFVELDGNNVGVSIQGNIQYKNNVSTYSVDQYGQFLRQYLEGLSFTLGPGPVGPPRPPPPNEDFPWKVVLGAVILSSVIIALRKKLKKKSKDKKKDEKKSEAYILQLNKDKFNLKINEPADLKAELWKVTELEKTRLNAPIQIESSEKALDISKKSGKGTLNSKLTLKSEPKHTPFTITVHAKAPKSAKQKKVTISTEQEFEIVCETVPDNKRSLRPNIDQILTCKAKVVDQDGQIDDELTQLIKYSPQSDWIDRSDPVYDEGFQMVNIGASDPDATAAVSHPPQYVVMKMLVEKDEDNKISLSQDLRIELLDCKLDTNTDEISFPVTGEQTQVTFLAFIEDCPGDPTWNFSASYKTQDNKPARSLSDIDIEKLSDIKAEIRLTGPKVTPKDNEQYIREKLVIEACQEDEEPLERHIYVTISKIGLYIMEGLDDNNELSFVADGKFERPLEFELYRLNEVTNEIEVYEEGLQNLQFELVNEEKEAKNIYSVLDPTFEFIGLFSNIPQGRYSFSTTGEIPGYGNEMELSIKAKATVKDSKQDPAIFENIIKLKVKTLNTGKRYPSWEEAYQECKYIIEEYVPKGPPQDKLSQLLEQRKHLLDAEGLIELRKRMWSIAYNLILAEGAEGYKSVDKWASRITTTLEWVEWMGDLAFSALASYFLKGLGATAASLIKAEVVGAIKFYVYEKDAGWGVFKQRQIDKIVPFLMSSAKGRLLSIDNIEMIVGKNKAACWAVYASCQFSYHLYNTGSIMQAAKLTGKEMRDELFISFLSKQLRASGTKNTKAQTTKKPAVKKNQNQKINKGSKKGSDDYAESPQKDLDLKGYSKESLKNISKVCKKHNVKIITRPTNKHAKKLIETGQAIPKKAFVKNKTISHLDTFIGASQKNIGKVGSFKPKLKLKQLRGLPKNLQKRIMRRYKQRRAEYRDQKNHIEENYDKLYVKKGVIYDRLTGKPFTGDIDIFDIRGPKGEPLPPHKVEKVIAELRRNHSISSVEHGAHLDWDLDNIKNPEDRRVAQAIYDTIVASHKKGGEALVEFGPDTSSGTPPKAIHYKGKDGVIHL